MSLRLKGKELLLKETIKGRDKFNRHQTVERYRRTQDRDRRRAARPSSSFNR